MKALTVWEPWASLIAEGAKPYEFRSWNFTEPQHRWRAPPKVGERIAIQAGARKMKLDEVVDLLDRLKRDGWEHTGLIRALAIPVLHRALEQLSRPKPRRSRQLELIDGSVAEPVDRSPSDLPLGSVICTAVIGEPTKNPVIAGKHLVEDSDRTDHLNWGWPMSDVIRTPMPYPATGKQGFWEYAFSAEALHGSSP